MEFEVETTSRNVVKRLGLDYNFVLRAYKESGRVWDLYIGKISLDESWRAFYSALGVSMSYARFKDMRKEAFSNAPIARPIHSYGGAGFGLGGLLILLISLLLC